MIRIPNKYICDKCGKKVFHVDQVGRTSYGNETPKLCYNCISSWVKFIDPYIQELGISRARNETEFLERWQELFEQWYKKPLVSLRQRKVIFT